jgi:aryl-alcohol dehydrogenase-like predicted oxidoreductase
MIPPSRIGLGLAALGRPAYINLGRDLDFGADRAVADFERRCHEMLDAAYAAGIRYVDAARSYGMAEAFLGTWLKTRSLPVNTVNTVDALTIGSKWGYSYVGSWRLDAPVHEVKALSVDTLRRQIAESRGLLGGHLRLYQIHSATLESGVLDDVAVLRELARLRSEGLAIGLTVSGPRQADVIRRALDVTVDGIALFQVVQATWNLLEGSAGPALADAKARGWGVIIKEALANGRLTDRNHASEVVPLTRQAEALGTTTDALALAAALSQPWSDVVLSGAVTVDQLHSNLAAVELIPHVVVPGAPRAPVADAAWPAMSEAPTTYWARRSALAWT